MGRSRFEVISDGRWISYLPFSLLLPVSALLESFLPHRERIPLILFLFLIGGLTVSLRVSGTRGRSSGLCFLASGSINLFALPRERGLFFSSCPRPNCIIAARLELGVVLREHSNHQREEEKPGGLFPVFLLYNATDKGRDRISKQPWPFNAF